MEYLLYATGAIDGAVGCFAENKRLMFPNGQVECYAGYRGEETLRRFYLEQPAIEIVEVFD